MDVNCCPRNDFSFPMKNSTKEFVSTWPTTATTIGDELTSTISSMFKRNYFFEGKSCGDVFVIRFELIGYPCTAAK